MSCYNCGKPGHMLRDCRDAKCFGCGKLGHIAPYCPGKQERLRCAGCGRFGHNKEECNMNNYNNKSGFLQIGMSPNALNVRTIERERMEEGRAVNVRELEEKNMECFRCRKSGHVARDCENL
ncbi:CCHC-type zinc finger nucleic acid binding protein-like [Gordionus sp. m RMFG-2023]|uniref:CCHC-type zinc finger nucleic acid binding protein-like n=1 Tax=Gordionus sp. m RMFG-2023 TaxID=3053472 RepID=UPI0031FC4D4E